MTEETDGELVAAVRGGDREAAGRLALRYLRASRAVALAIVGDIPAAEDVAQDAFVYALERIEDCRRPDRFGSWLLQIVRNRSRNALRDRKASRHVNIATVMPESRDATPQREAERSELRRRLIDALGKLSEVRREIVLLHDLEGWTHREIAERLDLPPGTVRSHLHHARKDLRPLLRGCLEEKE